MRELPSLLAIRAFEAAARLGSFTLAARELGVSQAAMSYQIKRLESQLATTLFIRRNRSVALTESGARIAQPITRAFDLLEEGLRQRDTESALSITTTVAFANMWLVPRLGDFQERHPDIQLKIAGLSNLADIEGGSYDIGIRLGRGNWEPLIAEKLFDVAFTPMCSPGFLAKMGGELAVAGLPKLPLIAQNDHRWPIWFAEAGYPGLQRVHGLQIGNQNEVIAAASADQGVGLVVTFFARSALESGALVCPFDQISRDGTAYWLVYDQGRRADHRIVAFRRWLLEAFQTQPYC